MQIKSCLKICGVGIVKSGCGQSGQSGSKDWKIDSNRWNITEFLHDDTDSQKTKADQKNNCGMVWWCDSKIDCISKSGCVNVLWIKKHDAFFIFHGTVFPIYLENDSTNKVSVSEKE